MPDCFESSVVLHEITSIERMDISKEECVIQDIITMVIMADQIRVTDASDVEWVRHPLQVYVKYYIVSHMLIMFFFYWGGK